MLEILDTPTVIKSDKKNPAKRIYLLGRADVVTAVAELRAADGKCCQTKACPEPHRLKVVYILEGEDAGIVLIAVKVGDRWNTYYHSERSIEKVGKKEAVGGAVSYYLTSEQVQPTEKLIGAYEVRRSIVRLTKQGPDIFPKRRSH
jgi:hypothetical protein